MQGTNWIETASGLCVNPFTMTWKRVRFADIAHALANICRFAGQSRLFYSVAQHSCAVAAWVEGAGGSLELIQAALLHDAAEAYLGDVPGPVKRHLSGFRKVETRLQREILRAFDVERCWNSEMIKEADHRVLVWECASLLPGAAARFFGKDKIAFPPDFVYAPAEAYGLFCDTAWKYRLKGM